MFNFLNELPNRTKGIVLAFLVGLAITGVLQFDFSSDNQDAEDTTLIEVQILVQSNDSEPISDVEIQVISEGAPVNLYTNSSGYSRVKIPSRGDVDVVLRKEGYDTRSETINLSIDPDRNRIFRLFKTEDDIQSFAPTNINYQHYTVQNDFFPLVLSILEPNLDIPILKEVFSQSLDIKTNPFVYIGGPITEIIENFKDETGNDKKIYEYLDGMIQFAARNPDSGIVQRAVILNSSSDEKGYTVVGEVEVKQDEDEYKKFVEDIIRGEDDLFSSFYFAPVLGNVQTDAEDAQYSAFVTTGYIENAGGIDGYLFQYPKLGDLIDGLVKDDLPEHFETEVDDTWIKKVIEANPSNRGFLAYSYPYALEELSEYRGCGEVGDWYITRYTPSPYVKFIDIENDTEFSFTVEGLSFKQLEVGMYTLTAADKRSSILEDLPDKEYATNLVLEPGEHFFVPIEFGFSKDSQKIETARLQDMDGIEKSRIEEVSEAYVAKPISSQSIGSMKLTELNYQEITENLMQKETLSGDFIQNTQSINSLFNSFPDRWAIGPILDVTSININGVSVSINPPGDKPSIYISNLIEGGSCPYLEIYDSIKDSWFDLGTVLTHRSDKNLQQQELHILGSGNITKIRLEEREQEISYIDAISFTYLDPQTNSEIEVKPNQPELNSADGNYLKLYEGDSLEFDLSELIPLDALKVRLKIDGYYEPTV